jgi:hypothetical protein
MGAAIKEIDNAAVLDRKDVVDHPPIDGKPARLDRFRMMVDLRSDGHRAEGKRSARRAVAQRSDPAHQRRRRLGDF